MLARTGGDHLRGDDLSYEQLGGHLHRPFRSRGGQGRRYRASCQPYPLCTTEQQAHGVEHYYTERPCPVTGCRCGQGRLRDCGPRRPAHRSRPLCAAHTLRQGHPLLSWSPSSRYVDLFPCQCWKSHTSFYRFASLFLLTSPFPLIVLQLLDTDQGKRCFDKRRETWYNKTLCRTDLRA